MIDTPTNKNPRKFLVVTIVLAVLAVVFALTFLIYSLLNNNQTSQTEIKIDPDIVFQDQADGTSTTQVLVSVQGDLTETDHLKIIKKYDNLPLVLVEIDSEGLSELTNNQNVESVSSNKTLELYNSLPTLGFTQTSDVYSVNGPDPVSTIGGNISGSPMPYYGDGVNKFAGSASSSGYEVVVIDTGVDKTHSILANKVVAEACFNSSFDDGTLKVESNCPSGNLSSTATGAGQDCTIEGCGHGTMVAGATAMGRVSLGNNVITAGSAPDAKIIARKIASKQSYITPSSTSNPCGVGVASCTVLYLSDVYSALDYSITLSQTRDKIAAVNMSLGAGAFNSIASCRASFSSTYDSFKSAINALKAKGIATVVATGNDGDGANQGKIGFPACVEGAVAVSSASVDGSHLAYYAQNGSLTTILAPGGDYNDGIFGAMWLPVNGNPNSFSGVQGTSFAAPTAAGAYAVLRSKWPNMSVDDMTQLLTSTGTPLTDSRSGYGGLTKPLINLTAALSSSVASLTSGVYTVGASDIQIDDDPTVQSLMNNLSTPYGFIIRDNQNAAVYTSSPTPYATQQTLTSALDAIGNGWTVATMSYPLDTYTPKIYTLAVASDPINTVTLNINNGAVTLPVPRGEDRIFTLTTTSTTINNSGYTLSAFNRTSNNYITIVKCNNSDCSDSTPLSTSVNNPTVIDSTSGVVANNVAQTKYKVTVAAGFTADAYSIIIGYTFARN
jgi:hypothetical protein